MVTASSLHNEYKVTIGSSLAEGQCLGSEIGEGKGSLIGVHLAVHLTGHLEGGLSLTLSGVELIPHSTLGKSEVPTVLGQGGHSAGSSIGIIVYRRPSSDVLLGNAIDGSTNP